MYDAEIAHHKVVLDGPQSEMAAIIGQGIFIAEQTLTVTPILHDISAAY